MKNSLRVYRKSFTQRQTARPCTCVGARISAMRVVAELHNDVSFVPLSLTHKRAFAATESI